jgi:hypothetical protein
MGTIITLTTDCGSSDAYVAAMKGIVLSINPEATLVDICHAIKPQNIAQAAFFLSTAYELFSERTIHMIVVDPGVGTERRAIILRTPKADFIAPDNGVLSYVLQDFYQQTPPNPSPVQATPSEQPRQVKREPGLEAVAITRPQFWRSPVNSTFHGRDIFAPVAANLSLGSPPEDFGEAITSLKILDLPRPCRSPDGTLVGQVIHLDNFGNLITNVKSNHLTSTKQAITIEIGEHTIHGLSHTYAESDGLLALIGSSGYLEISLKEGDASVFLNAGIGFKVKIIRNTS